MLRRSSLLLRGYRSYRRTNIGCDSGALATCWGDAELRRAVDLTGWRWRQSETGIIPGNGRIGRVDRPVYIEVCAEVVCVCDLARVISRDRRIGRVHCAIGIHVADEDTHRYSQCGRTVTSGVVDARQGDGDVLLIVYPSEVHNVLLRVTWINTAIRRIDHPGAACHARACDAHQWIDEREDELVMFWIRTLGATFNSWTTSER